MREDHSWLHSKSEVSLGYSEALSQKWVRMNMKERGTEGGREEGREVGRNTETDKKDYRHTDRLTS